MCDDLIQPDQKLALGAVSRREFAVLGAAAALAGCTGAGAREPSRQLSERTVQISTEDGLADAFFVHPASGAFPGVVLWPDIAGLRDAFKIMARRLADSGYAVLVVNQYYRSSPAPVFESFAGWRTPEGQAKLKPMIAAITPAGTLRDARAFVTFLDGDAAVDKARGIGTQGYCMGGPFAVRTAAAVPARVRAAASFHGANLVSDDADSPVKLIAATKADYLFAIAHNDDAKQPDAKDALKAACAAARRPATVEVYDADHGWCVADSPAYDPNAADKAWDALEALYAKL